MCLILIVARSRRAFSWTTAILRRSRISLNSLTIPPASRPSSRHRYWKSVCLGRKNIHCCTGRGDVLNYRRFRELMPPVGLYSESRPDRTRF